MRGPQYSARWPAVIFGGGNVMSDGSRELVNDTNTPPPAHRGPLTRRWTEQRWLLDNTIRSVGMDWDQPRSLYLSVPRGPEANADFAAIRQRITKLADAS